MRYCDTFSIVLTSVNISVIRWIVILDISSLGIRSTFTFIFSINSDKVITETNPDYDALHTTFSKLPNHLHRRGLSFLKELGSF